MKKLQEILHQCNTYIERLILAAETTMQNNVNIVFPHKKKLKPSEAHTRTYNRPESSEIAALVPGKSAGDRDLIKQSNHRN